MVYDFSNASRQAKQEWRLFDHRLNKISGVKKIKKIFLIAKIVVTDCVLNMFKPPFRQQHLLLSVLLSKTQQSFFLLHVFTT